ncbi:MAG: hypothetical protein WDN06_21865 [Asticcacaulis sp.]
MRLFYVALTRARDRLTLCGYAGKATPRAGNFPPWYDLAAAAFDRLPVATATTMKLEAPFDDLEQMETAIVRIHGERAPLLTAEAKAPSAAIILPAFATEKRGPGRCRLRALASDFADGRRGSRRSRTRAIPAGIECRAGSLSPWQPDPQAVRNFCRTS